MQNYTVCKELKQFYHPLFFIYKIIIQPVLVSKDLFSLQSTSSLIFLSVHASRVPVIAYDTASCAAVSI